MPEAEQLEDVDAEENDVGHMLKTVNPEAAAAIDNPPAPPDVSTMVVFKGRSGFSRMHRNEFPAIVLGSHEDGTLILLVMLEPEDMMMETRVPFRSHNQDQFYWRYRLGDESGALLAPRVAEIEEFLRGEDKLGEIIEAIGKRVETVEGVLMSDEIEKLEARIAALEKAAGKRK